MIVSWSPISGQGATTSHVAALAAHYALTNNNHSLLTHTSLRYSALELLFGKIQSKAKGFEDAGLAALERLAKSHMLKSDVIKDYTETIYAGSLDLLGGFQNNRSSDFDLFESLLPNLLEAYDLVWIDANKSDGGNAGLKVLDQADLILINLPQNRFILDRFYGDESFQEKLKDKNCIVLLSQYDSGLQFNIHKIKRKYKVKCPIFAIPSTSQFRNASNKMNLSDYFYTHVTSRNNASSSIEFIKSLEKVNMFISKDLKLSGREAVE